MKPAIRYFGGKSQMINHILARVPVHRTYIEAYGGSGAVLLAKQPTGVELWNDLERNVYSLMHVISNKALFAEFECRARIALVDEATSVEYVRALAGELDALDRAFMFWYVTRTRRAGGSSGGFSSNLVQRRGMAKTNSDFLSAVDRLPELHERLKRVLVRNCDALTLIEKCDRVQTFIYLDPPYVQDTRTDTRYTQDADNDHHTQLVDLLLRIRHAQVMVSGYAHPIYERLEAAGWHRHDIQINTVSGTLDPKVRTETLWMNYKAWQLKLFE